MTDLKRRNSISAIAAVCSQSLLRRHDVLSSFLTCSMGEEEDMSLWTTLILNSWSLPLFKGTKVVSQEPISPFSSKRGAFWKKKIEWKIKNKGEKLKIKHSLLWIEKNKMAATAVVQRIKTWIFKAGLPAQSWVNPGFVGFQMWTRGSGTYCTVYWSHWNTFNTVFFHTFEK